MATRKTTRRKRRGRLTVPKPVFPEIELVDDLPARGQARGSWAARLEICIDNPSRWARIFIADSPEQAQNCQDNLHGRKVIIPRADHMWDFASRGVEVFACYRGGVVKRNDSSAKSFRRAKP